MGRFDTIVEASASSEKALNYTCYKTSGLRSSSPTLRQVVLLPEGIDECTQQCISHQYAND